MSIRLETVGTACLVTLDRPEKRNALRLDDIVELTGVIAAAGARADIDGIVLSGNGAFCAGADLHRLTSTLGTTDSERKGNVEGPAQGLIWALLDAPVPTIAAVDGPAVGLGFDLALACDSLLIGPDGWCMQGWGRIGLIPGTGGDLLLRARAPHLLWRLLEHQPRIDGPQAEQWQLGEAVGSGTARDAALQRIQRLGQQLSREALTGYVTLSRSEIKARLTEHLPTCAAVQARLLGRDELTARVHGVLPTQS
jgi:enoyl-CoA hydratase/carnithine racemase